MTLTLTVDCGGSGIKAAVVDQNAAFYAPRLREPTPYPLPPSRFVELIAELSERLPQADRVTVGFPGMVRHGVVIATPHYVNADGPRTSVVTDLVTQWHRCDLQTLISARLNRPTLVLNDAQVHGAGVIRSTGTELVLTFGTGMGWALFDDGRPAPHLEMSHAPFTRSLTYDFYIGELERLRLGNARWSNRVLRVVERLRPVVHWDRIYLGGGNARKINSSSLDAMGTDVTVVQNKAGLIGGVRAWHLHTAHLGEV